MMYEQPSHTPSYTVIPYDTTSNKNSGNLEKYGLGKIQIDLFENSTITSPDHFQRVNHIKFSISPSLRYSPGDVLVVHPKNDKQLVDSMKSLFDHVDEKKLFTIQPLCNGQPSTRLVNFHWLCKWYFDLNAIPRRYFFYLLSQYSTDDVEKNKLIEFYLPENIDSFYSYCSRPRRNYYESLRDFSKSVKCLDIGCLLELIPSMKAREYSICSSYSHESKLDIVVALVRYQTVIVQPRHGLCSNYLCNLRSGESVSVELKPNKNIQLIMIATGTGCAAYRAYVQSMPYERSFSTPLVPVPQSQLRNREKDFLFGNDWELFERNGTIKLFLAFSRDQNEKIYVQNKLIENGKLVWDSIQRGAYIYVSGNAKRMPDQIYEAFLDMATIHGSMTLESAKIFLNSLERHNRYQTETY
ncbi:hypothetical protein MXB_673 [Myxobolus squamalis]|nr:hypothetical protein MXB_673 [Myxobolus squamalis]